MIVLGAALLAGVSMGTTFNVLNFGAVGDGVHNDTAAIQSAIDKATEMGGATVLLPANHRFRSGSIFLKSHVDFFIDRNATLLGSKVSSRVREDRPYKRVLLQLVLPHFYVCLYRSTTQTIRTL